MTEQELNKLGSTRRAIADDLRSAMNGDDFRESMLPFLFLRYLSDNKRLFQHILSAFLHRYQFDLPEMITETTRGLIFDPNQ